MSSDTEPYIAQPREFLREGVFLLNPGEGTRLHQLVDRRARLVLQRLLTLVSSQQLTPVDALAGLAQLVALRNLLNDIAGPVDL